MIKKNRQYNDQNTDNTMIKKQTIQWPKNRQYSDKKKQKIQWPKEKGKKRSTMVDKTLHIKLNNRQHKSHHKTVGELMSSGRVYDPASLVVLSKKRENSLLYWKKNVFHLNGIVFSHVFQLNYSYQCQTSEYLSDFLLVWCVKSLVREWLPFVDCWLLLQGLASYGVPR